MSLNTPILIREPVNPRGLFGDLKWMLERFPDTPELEWFEEPGLYAVRPARSAPAHLEVRYAVDGPLRREGAPIDGHCVQVNFETAYSYRGMLGGHCSDLHAFLIVMVYAYLDVSEIESEVCWRNEYTGEWFTNLFDAVRLGNPTRADLSPLVAAFAEGT